jgi:uncharacterized protein
MKYLLVLAVVAVAFWIWRNNRRAEVADRTARRPDPRHDGKPVTMVACRVCGTHLPHTDAVQGRQGLYCGQEHRQQLEGPAC